jgi:hypothetical protein
MVAKKNPVAKPTKPATAPKVKKVSTRAIAPAPLKAPKPGSVQNPESGKPKDAKEKKGGKKARKSNEGDNPAGKKKMVRDSFTMPAPDYALIGVLKSRTLASGTAVKKSELLRAGLVALAAMPPAHLIDLIAAMPQIKTGRPGNKKK